MAGKRALAGVELEVVVITHEVSSKERHGWGGGQGSRSETGVKRLGLCKNIVIDSQ